MKLGYTILYVESVPDTVAFYEAAFGLARRMVAPSGDYAEMQTGETRLAFAENAMVRTLTSVPFVAARPDQAAPAMELGLVTADVEAAYATAVAAGAVAVKRPETKPWGQVVGYVRDNNGFLVEICSPMES